jgi:hypothetical protein
MTNRPWHWYTSPLAYALGGSALSLLALLLPATPRILAVIPLGTTLYTGWVLLFPDAEERSDART